MTVRSGAIVVGSGPNGLAAAIELARSGRAVRVLEGAAVAGGGVRSEALTRPGFVHDTCSAVHPLAAASPFFTTLPLDRFGLLWTHADRPLAHPLDGGRAVVLERSLSATAGGLDADGPAYLRLSAPFVRRWQALFRDVFAPLRVPRDPVLLARFGLVGGRSAHSLARRAFAGTPARALLAGLAAHATLRLDEPFTAAVALVLSVAAHTVGWPFPRGGASHFTQALLNQLTALGGTLSLAHHVASTDAVPPAAAVLFDVSPRQLLDMAGSRLPPGYRRRLARYRHGMGVFKIDWALDAAIPWTASACRGAAVVHIGGTLEEIATAEREVAGGGHPSAPFVLLGQPTLFDPTRAPAGKHVAWAYCHVPWRSRQDMTAAIEQQVDRFAPGFQRRILDRHVMTTHDLEAHNPNLVGGDISGGAPDWRQLFWRPTRRAYRLPVPGWYLCSASTPPGPGVHGMCGFHAARAVLRDQG
jgi:phytoene dehydrogenase-like protein